MPKEYIRTDRLSQLIQRELALLIQQEVKDPRLGMVTVSAVKLSRDLSHAKIYITVFGNEETIKNNLEILNHAASYLRTMLGKRIKIRVLPQLVFVYDISISEGNRLSALIDAAIAEDEKRMDDHIDIE